MRKRSADLYEYLEHKWEGGKKKYVATRPLLTTRRFLSVTLGKLYFHLLDALSAEFHNEINAQYFVTINRLVSLAL